MNRFGIILAVVGIILATAIASQQTHALDYFVTEEHKQRIAQNCVAAQATLYQLHASDALLRVNRGKLYENISTKLMAQLNSRIALNKHEGLKLSATTLEYDRQVDIFRSDYRLYEEAMTKTLDSKCADDPVAFYNDIQSTREKRQRLHEDTETLTALLNTYKTEFEDFSTKLEGGAQ